MFVDTIIFECAKVFGAMAGPYFAVIMYKDNRNMITFNAKPMALRIKEPCVSATTH